MDRREKSSPGSYSELEDKHDRALADAVLYELLLSLDGFLDRPYGSLRIASTFFRFRAVTLRPIDWSKGFLFCP